ncbi:hypothetical protein FQN55_001490 [Onygenales sp. PD_40]|nr:hypothetical protein FQN55_001490 [Onygenales sp. PD_40]KAK2777077.1 hypothetical protein FQN53_002418 [Emmonsiellopsis sp. PD_33]KAK2794972.1 hypothetical protein FQN52_006851 [Onygenales sp. PD_12]KAK2797378.1 hypothetical protein FQN51_008549 [Onygenales sp. PD_10]
MKFAHDYIQTLSEEDYPSQWVQSAISYRQLKKCIKKVRKELLSLGLRPEILNLLWNQDQVASTAGDEGPRSFGFRYSLDGSPSSSTWLPKLTFVLDPNDGSPVDAFVSPETLEILQRLNQSLPSLPPTSNNASQPELDALNAFRSLSPSEDTSPETSPVEDVFPLAGENAESHTVEIPLSSDSEFFRILREELSSLDKLQEKEQAELNLKVKDLRQDIVRVATPSLRRSQSALYAWREIFRLYIDLQVFFCTDEVGSGQRDSLAAGQQLQKFQTELAQDRRVKKLGKEGRVALNNFLRINSVLLQNLKFQEINQLALTKILKKFDKRTALHARTFLPRLMSTETFLAETMAKAVCYTISEEVLPIIPQLDDYLCPICFSISFKPVRLRCNHVFCIRCMVVMQRAKQNQCALCRQGVVMEATGENLDTDLLAFLSATFPKETKTKQKENEKAATADLYGDSYDACSVM